MVPAVRFLVTGATGFVGRAVARRLLGEGETLHVLARDPGDAESLREKGARVFAGSVADPNEVADAARGVDVVIHAAAVASHRAATRALTWVNVAGTENVIAAARHVGAARLVFISCADVTLHNLDRVHWNEDKGLTGRPLDAHAESKLLAEELVLASARDGFEATALRPAILWGPGDTTTLPELCRQAQRRGLRLVGQGRNLVSTTYIEHLVDAVLVAAEVSAANARSYLVTDGEFLDAREFLDGLASAAGLPVPRPGPSFPVAYAMAVARQVFRLAGPRPTDVVRWGRSTHFDTQRLRTDLELEPRFTMDEGYRALARWVEEVGGPHEVARMGRLPPDAASVDDQVKMAGGEG
jgi:nucleoside-diphosphate-sugar epimerase